MPNKLFKKVEFYFDCVVHGSAGEAVAVKQQHGGDVAGVAVERAHPFAVVHVEHLERVALVAGGDEARRDQLEREHRARVEVSDGALARARLQVPYTHRAVHGAAGEHVLGHDLERGHVAPVTRQRAHTLAARHVPQLDAIVPRSARHMIATIEQRQRRDRIRVAVECARARAVAQVPHLYREKNS